MIVSRSVSRPVPGTISLVVAQPSQGGGYLRLPPRYLRKDNLHLSNMSQFLHSVSSSFPAVVSTFGSTSCSLCSGKFTLYALRLVALQANPWRRQVLPGPYPCFLSRICLLQAPPAGSHDPGHTKSCARCLLRAHPEWRSREPELWHDLNRLFERP